MVEARIQIILSDGKKAGETLKELGKDANRLNKELKDLKPGTQQFIDKSKDLQAVNARMKEVKEQITGTSKASEALKAAFDQFVPFSGTFAAVGRQLGVAKGGVGGLTTSFGALRGAIAATGIGALVIALATLFDWFRKTDEGATLLAGIFKGLENITDKVFASLRGVGEALFKAFQNPKQAAMDLLEFIGNNLLNRVKAFVVIFEGLMDLDFKKVIDGTIQLTTGVENATDKMSDFANEVGKAVDEGIAFEKQLDAIADKARDLSIVQKESEGIVKQLILQSKNVALSYEDRLKALDKASAIELANHRQQLENARALEKLMKDERDQKFAVGKATDEVEQKLADATIARIERENESLELQQKIENRRSLLLEERQREVEKQAADELKVRQNLEDLRVQAMEEGLQKEIEQINLSTEQKIEALTGSAEEILQQETLLEEIRQQEIQAVKDKFAAEAAAKDKKDKEDQQKRDQELADEQKRIRTALADAESQIEEVRMDTFRTGVSGFGELLGKQIKDEKEARRVRKQFAIADIGIGLAQELAANSAAGAKISAQAPPFTIPAGIAYTTASNIRSYIRAGLATAKVLLFNKGGFTGEGADDEPAGVVHKNEYVIPARITQNPKYKGMINALEAARLKGYQYGGPVNPFQARPAVSLNNQRSSGALSPLGGDVDAMLQEFRSFRAEISAWPRTIKIINVATETADVIKTINTIKEAADI